MANAKGLLPPLCGLLVLWGAVLRAQQVPAAVISDPPAYEPFPAVLVPTTVPSHGVDMDALFYLASGSEPHGTVLLLHGLPGYESNGDLAQSIRRAGWHVMIFHYRGAWGTAGAFSASSAIEDTAEAVRFLRDPANAAKYHADPHKLAIVGHSFGGFLAGYEASHDPAIRAVAMISAVNLGTINADPKERESRLQRWEKQLHPIRGSTAPDLFREAALHSTDWDYVKWAEPLCARPTLLVEADDQNHADMEGLGAAMMQKGCSGLEKESLSTDHSFSDRRIALQTIVVNWLEKLRTP